MLSFGSNNVLPKEVVISSVDDLLYEIGLCLTSVRERPKRRAINSPVVIAVFCGIYLCERIASIIIDESHHGYLLLLGDYGRFMKLKTHLNLILIILISISMTSQLNYYNNHKR